MPVLRRCLGSSALALPLVLPLVLPVGLVPFLSPAAAEARANPAPRIIGARMVDVDHDDKADRLVLTWSEPVRHAADADGHYPFAVSGYAVRSVAGASGSRTLTLVLAEHSTRDISAHPTVRYVKTKKGAVKDLQRKQAATSSFTRTTPLDLDHDGYAARDCAPTRASIHPGAPDRPDTGGLDSNCDGIDGQRTGPVFVSPLGSDSNPGTITAPVETFAQAVSTAGGTRDIYLAGGSYPVSLSTPVTSSVYGGYTATWKRSAAAASTLTLAQPYPIGDGSTLQLVRLAAPGTTDTQGSVAARATDVTARLEQVQVSSGPGTDGTLGTPALDSVALVATGSHLTFVGGSITSGAGGNGAAGTAGTAGAAGGDGTDGTNGSCSLGAAVAAGGAGGAAGSLGGVGVPGASAARPRSRPAAGRPAPTWWAVARVAPPTPVR